MTDKKEHTILIVDDEKEVVTMLKRTLERRGYEVVTAFDGEQGLEVLSQTNVHVVICDIVMPKLDGVAFIKEVKKHNPAVEVIMITGNSTVDRCVEVVEHGACGYLIKPVDIAEVLEHINRAERNIVEKKEMLKKAFEDKHKH